MKLHVLEGVEKSVAIDQIQSAWLSDKVLMCVRTQIFRGGLSAEFVCC